MSSSSLNEECLYVTKMFAFSKYSEVGIMIFGLYQRKIKSRKKKMARNLAIKTMLGLCRLMWRKLR